MPPGYIYDKRSTIQAGILELPPAYTAVQNTTTKTVTAFLTIQGTSTPTGSPGEASGTEVGNTCPGTNVKSIALGIGLGAALPLAMLLAASLVFLLRERRRVKQLQQTEREHHGVELQGGQSGRVVYPKGRPNESQRQEIHEAPSTDT